VQQDRSVGHRHDLRHAVELTAVEVLRRDPRGAEVGERVVPPPGTARVRHVPLARSDVPSVHARADELGIAVLVQIAHDGKDVVDRAGDALPRVEPHAGRAVEDLAAADDLGQAVVVEIVDRRPVPPKRIGAKRRLERRPLGDVGTGGSVPLVGNEARHRALGDDLGKAVAVEITDRGRTGSDDPVGGVVERIGELARLAVDDANDAEARWIRAPARSSAAVLAVVGHDDDLAGVVGVVG